jgi:hypothetical protein
MIDRRMPWRIAVMPAMLLVAGCPRPAEPADPGSGHDSAMECDGVRALVAAELAAKVGVVMGHGLAELDVPQGRRLSLVAKLSEFDDIAASPSGLYMALASRTPAKVAVLDTWAWEHPMSELVDRSADREKAELHVSIAGTDEQPKLAVWLRRSSPTPVNVGPIHNWADARTAPRSGVPMLSGNADWLAIANGEGTSVHSLSPAGVGEGTVLPCRIDPVDARNSAPTHAVANDGTLGCLEIGAGARLMRFAQDGTVHGDPVAASARGLIVLAEPWMPGDLRWLVFGDEPAVELIGGEQRERIELPFVPRQIAPLAPEMLAVVDDQGHFALVRRDGTLRYSSICGPASPN